MNDRVASSWQGHRLMAIMPFLLIIGTAKDLREHPSAIRFGVVLVPLVVLFLGTLLLRPYRKISRVSCTFILSDEALTLEDRVDSRRLNRTVVPWKDIIAAEEADNVLVLHLRKDALHLSKECFQKVEDRQAVLTRIGNFSVLSSS